MSGWGGDSLSLRRNGLWILREVSVEWSPGQVNAVLGPNGSGKTTLLRLLAGLVPPDEGTVARGMTRGWKEPDWARTVACVLEPSPPDLPFCVEEVLLSSQFPDGGRWLDPSAERQALLAGMLDRLEVFPEGGARGLNRPYATLSSGERQLVDLIRAILQPTRILILDEPTSALDLRHRLLVRDLLIEETKRNNRTVALSLHDLLEVDSWIDQVVVLQGGRAVASGPPARILTQALLAQVWGVVPVGTGYRLHSNAGDRN